MSDALWDGFDTDPVLAQRSNASKLRYIANHLPNLRDKPHLTNVMMRMLHEVAGDIDVKATTGSSELASVESARRSLQALRETLPFVGREIDAALQRAREYKRLRRALGDARRDAAREHARYESTIKEARRQATRAKAAEAKLRGEQA